MKTKTSRSAMWGRKALIVAAILAGASLASAQWSRKISRDLQNAKGSVDVIVTFNQPVSASMHNKVFQHGGTLHRELSLIRGGSYQIPAANLQTLAADPAVAHISPNRSVHGLTTTAGTQPALDYHYETMNASAGWAAGLDGTGIGVAVIDSGIANVDDLTRSHVVYSQDFTGQNTNSDRYGHGTHVSGIIAGTGADSTGPTDFYTFHGIAPGVNLIALRVLDQNGNGTDAGVIAAIQTAIQLKDTYNIRIINLSLGSGVFESYVDDPLCQAVEQAWQAGIVVVVSAGNDGRDNSVGTNGYGTITSPGNDPYVITVGAMNTMGTPDRTDDVPASYSSKGPSLWDQIIKPDIVAPGNLIVSLYTPMETLALENPGNIVPYSMYQNNGRKQLSSEYFILSGTSMAAPMVSGAAALLLEQNPSLTPDQVKAILMTSAFKNLIPNSVVTDPTTGQTFDEQANIFTIGAGYLDVQAALQLAATPPPAGASAMSPSAGIDASGNLYLVNGTPSNGEPVLWSGSVPWNTSASGESIIWGTNAIQNESILWGTSVLWGTGSTDAESILWGTSSLASQSVLWGTSTVDTESVLWGTSILWGTSSSNANSVLWGTGTTAAEAVMHGDAK